MRELVGAARGEGAADLALLNASVFNPFLCEWEETALGIEGGRVLGPGVYPARRELDLGGARVIPGLIDPHVHVESSLLSPFEYARLAAVHGTTTVVADPHEIANVLGVPGIEYMLACRPHLPIDLLLTLPSCVPATPADVGGAVIGAAELVPLAQREGVVGLGEVMNVPGLLAGDPDLVAKVVAFGNVDGHAPGLAGLDLNAYVLAGAQSDHEAATAAEGRDRLARGMYLFLREGSTERNLEALLPLVTPSTAPRCAFCTDDRHADLICREGLVDDCVRRAIEFGLEPELGPADGNALGRRAVRPCRPRGARAGKAGGLLRAHAGGRLRGRPDLRLRRGGRRLGARDGPRAAAAPARAVPGAGRE